MHILAIISNLRLQDVFDILFLTIVAYHLYLWFRGTKAFKALVGLIVLGIIFTVARTWGLFLTTWVFQILWQVLVLLLIILFQSEIRQVLERVNPLQAIGLRIHPVSGKWIPEYAKAVFTLAQRGIGSLYVIERTDRVEEWLAGSQRLEGDPSPELLISIFQKESPLHDGAVLLRNGRIVRVTCYLPLSATEGLPSEWGTRHRAALGLTEKCDALVIAVSEERGEVSITSRNKMTTVKTHEALSGFIDEKITPAGPPQVSWKMRIRSLLLSRWQTKVGTLALIIMFWLLLAGQQDFERTLSVGLEIKNIPPETEILEPLNPRIKISVRGLRKDASTLNEDNVRASLDLSMARVGKSVLLSTGKKSCYPMTVSIL